MFGHAHTENVRKLAASKAVTGVSFESVRTTRSPYEGCFLGKKCKVHLLSEGSRSTKIGKFIHGDLSGRMTCNSPGGSSYYVTFTGECSSYVLAAAVEKKPEVALEFQKFAVWSERKYDCTGKKLHCDRSGDAIAEDEFLR